MANRYYIPADTKGDQTITALQAAARVVRTQMARNLAGLGLYPGQETVIAALAENGAMTPGEIARLIGVRPPTITKTITRLQEQGFVQRTASTEDGRLVHVSLTENGLSVVTAMRKAARKTEKTLLATLKKKERKQLESALAAIMAAAQADAS